MQGGSAADGAPREGDPPAPLQQQQTAGLMGISHRHDEALAHNPTPAETLERRTAEQVEEMMSSVPAATGTLGVAPSPLHQPQDQSAVGSDVGVGGLGAHASSTTGSSMPPTLLFPQTLFGKAAQPARAVPQSASSPPGTPQKAYGMSEQKQIIEPAPAPAFVLEGEVDQRKVQEGAINSTASSPDAARLQRKRVNSDGSNSSTLVEMLMRSSPSRLRPRVGTNEYENDSSALHVVAKAGGEEAGHNSSDDESEGGKIAVTSSKYDYDTSWDMVGHRAIMKRQEQAEVAMEAQEGAASDSQTSGVASAAVAASAAIAATVNEGGAVGEPRENMVALDSSPRPITPTTDLYASTAAVKMEASETELTPLSTVSADQVLQSRSQQRRAEPLSRSQLSVPSSPILLVPRRRTRSTSDAGLAHYVAGSQSQLHANRKRRDYVQQKYSTSDLNKADSVDIDDDFEDVQNIHSADTQDSTARSANDDACGDNPFDDFDGTPVVPRAVSDGGDVSRGPGAVRSRDASVRSVSSSSSSSITHRRRRGQVGPAGTTIFGGQSAQSVSSFSGSMSTATASVQFGRGRIGQHIPSEHDISEAHTDDDSDETNRAARSLRASLDAGMAAMRRWARSHAGVAGSAAASAAQAGGRGPARSSRAATMQLGEEDLFALANAGADPRRSNADLEDEDVLRNDTFGLAGLSVFAPIAEEDEGTAAGRNRAFSEPDRARVRNFFGRRTLQNRGSPQTRASSRQNRAIGSSTSGRYGGRIPGQSTNPVSAAQFGSSVISHLSSTDITSGARTLSSAAMSSSLFHSNSMPPQEASARAIAGGASERSFDQVDLLERGNAPTPSSIEDSGESSSRSVQGGEDDAQDGVVAMNMGDPDEGPQQQQAASIDLERQARRRWVRINRRFQVLITIVALIFSLILFAILVCWIVLTSSYVVSIDKACDVPLKKYFWLATLQLVFDVFRTDIMRLALRWDPNSGQRIPARVVLYNVAYLIYAICVLRLGVKSVFFSPESTCPDTASEFYQASAAFVTLSLAAWSTIVVGYLFPFCFVAIILTRNGYSPSADFNGEDTGIPGVFPNAYANAGAPPECIDRLQVIMLHEFPDDYPRECCICMSDFSAGEVIVVTNCEHVFHKRCCQEWLQQARTCPVCRTDIPTALGMSEHGSDGEESVDGETRARPNRPPLNREEFHQEVVSLLRILRQHEERLRERISDQDREDDGEHMSAASDNRSLPRSFGGATGDIEERMQSEEVQSAPDIRPRSE